MVIKIFIEKDGRTLGPLSAADLKALADSGKLMPDDLVWQEGSQTKVPAKQVKGLLFTNPTGISGRPGDSTGVDAEVTTGFSTGVVCPACGKGCESGARICGHCGEKMTGGSQQPVPSVAELSQTLPISEDEAVVEIGMGIILSIITCGFYQLFWQARQFKVLNAWLGRKEFGFWSWFLLGIITCGFYMIYCEYKMANAILEVRLKHGRSGNSQLPILCLFLSLFGFSIVSMAIQQDEINNLYR